LIDTISVDEPNDPEDELHFVKLVTWCYVFIFEASQPATRFILALLRVASPDQHKNAKVAFEIVNVLRTARVHNLLPSSKGGDFKQRQARIWLTQNGGDPFSWPTCCQALSDAVAISIGHLIERWRAIVGNKEDSARVIADLIMTIDREWPPHAFDRMIENAAIEIGLSGLDFVKYRETRLAKWRELAGFFESREHAEVAMNSAIRSELEQLFGRRLDSTSRSSEV
jgi:hypothetical protein